MSKHVVFFLGLPGAGKGTQCACIVKKYPVVHLSAGDLLRAEIASGSPDGDMIAELIKEGKIVPSEITVRLLINAMHKSDKRVFLIDGFPRSEENRSAWFNVAGAEGIVTEGCICIDVDEESMKRRIMERGAVSNRTDDNIESLMKRKATFMNDTKPVLDCFEHDGKLTCVNGVGSVDEVFARIDQVINPIFKRNNITY